MNFPSVLLLAFAVCHLAESSPRLGQIAQLNDEHKHSLKHHRSLLTLDGKTTLCHEKTASLHYVTKRLGFSKLISYILNHGAPNLGACDCASACQATPSFVIDGDHCYCEPTCGPNASASSDGSSAFVCHCDTGYEGSDPDTTGCTPIPSPPPVAYTPPTSSPTVPAVYHDDEIWG